MLSFRTSYAVKILYRNKSDVEMYGFDISRKKIVDIIEKLDLKNLIELTVNTDDLYR